MSENHTGNPKHDESTDAITQLVFILDRSGSMGGSESDTIGGFNSMLEKQKQEEGNANVTTVLFDDKYELLHDRIDISEINPITASEYTVRGTTALLDAIGRTINDFKLYNRVMMIITTDGLENASREFSRPQIKSMIEQQTEMGWEFIFLGADMDAIAEARHLGISPDKAVRYHKDGVGMASKYDAMSEVSSRYRKGEYISASWKHAIETGDPARRQGEAMSEEIECYYMMVHDGCPVVSLDGERWLIDIGCPVTINDRRDVDLFGTFVQPKNNFMGVSLREISRQIDTRIDGIAGCDALTDKLLYISFQDSVFAVARPMRIDDLIQKLSSELGKRIDPRIITNGCFETTNGGAPIVNVRIEGKPYRLAIDTGAKISYINSDVTIGLPSSGTESDYHPGFGKFQTELYDTNVAIQGTRINVKFGNLPAALQRLATFEDIDGFLGSDLFAQFDVVLDMRMQSFYLL
jgi:hypothetical protein